MWVCVIARQTSMGLDGGEPRGMKRTDFRGWIRWPGGAKDINETQNATANQKTQHHNQKHNNRT